MLRVNQKIAKLGFNEVGKKHFPYRAMNRLISVVSILVFLCFMPTISHGIEAGKQRFTVEVSHAGKTIDFPVYAHVPKTLNEETKVLVVMHGTLRDAENYLNTWIDLAKGKNLLLLAPEFSKAQYPGVGGYNLANISTGEGALNPKDEWGFSVVEQVFDEAQRRFGTHQKGYDIFGHSAGAQFVHRMVLLYPENRIERAFAANAGWYTFPKSKVDYPYGLNRAPVEHFSLQQALSSKLIVLVGAEDNQRRAQYLRRTPQANRQGRHRLARAKNFYEYAVEIAANSNYECQWELVLVEGVAHSSTGMSNWVCEHYF